MPPRRALPVSMDEVRLPKLGMDMTEARVVKWLVDAGAAVRKGDPLVEIETDKVTVVLQAPDSGVLDRIVVAEDGVASAGDVLGIIVTAGRAAGGSRISS